LAALATEYEEMEKVSINIYLLFWKSNLTTFITAFPYVTEW
jgi:hypothetical protein